MSLKDIRYYYADADFQNHPENPLGAFPLRYIYNILPLKEGSIGQRDFVLEISCGVWF